VSELPLAQSPNDRRNIAVGFVLRRIPETGSITAGILEVSVKRDFEPCEKSQPFLRGRFKEWYRYQHFNALLSKLYSKGYVVLKNAGKKISNKKSINHLTTVSRGRNYSHYINDSESLVAIYLKAFPIPVLDELASL
jgi:hypothetical protein